MVTVTAAFAQFLPTAETARRADGRSWCRRTGLRAAVTRAGLPVVPPARKLRRGLWQPGNDISISMPDLELQLKTHSNPLPIGRCAISNLRIADNRGLQSVVARHNETYAKPSLKKYKPMVAWNEVKKVFSGLL